MSTPVLSAEASPAPPHEASDATQCHHTLTVALPYHRPLTTAEKRRLEEAAVKTTEALLSRWAESDKRLSRRWAS